MNNEFGLAFSSVTVTVSLAAIIPDTPIVSIAGSTLSEITTTTTSTTTTPTPTPLSKEPTKSSPEKSGGGATKNLKSMSDVNAKSSSSGSKNVASVTEKNATTVNDILNDIKTDNSTVPSTSTSDSDELKDNITDSCNYLSIDIIPPTTAINTVPTKQTTAVPSPNLKRDVSPPTSVPFDGLKLEENTNNETRTKDGLKDWEESRLKELLEEAYSYKNPRDKENKSEAFLQLLKETENEKEDQSFTFPAITSRYTRNSSATSTSNSHHHHQNQYKQGGSLQDIIEAIRNESQLDFYAFGVGGQRTRNRHNHNSRQKKYSTTVSSRQREGGSLPSNVNVTTCGSLLANSTGAGADNSAVEQQPLFVNESYKTASNKQKRNIKAAAAAATASAKETDSEFSALLCGIAKGAKAYSAERAQITKEHNNKSESSAAAPSGKWAWSGGGSGGSSSNNNNSTTTTANSYSGGDCVIEVGEWMDIQQQQQILQSQADADMKGLHYYERLDNMNLRIPRANIISSASGNANMAPANTHTFVDETVRFATMEQSSKAMNAVGNSSVAAVASGSSTSGAGGDASGNTVLSNTVVSVDPATLCVGTLEYLPLNENYQSCKSLLGMIEKPNDTTAVTAIGSTMFSTTKTITRQFDENGNALHEMYQSSGTGSVIGSSSHTTSTVNVGSGTSAGVGNNGGINTYTSGINTGGQSQGKTKSKKKSQQDRNTKTVDVESVAGYRGNDPVELLVKYIESTDDNGNKQNDAKSGGGGCGGGNASNKFNDKEKKKERKKDKEKHKMKKSNSLEELRSGAKMEVDDLKRTAATTESNVMLRNKSKTNKNNSASTADINKNFTEPGSKICNNANTINTAATSGARKSERRSWGTEELQYLGGDMSIKTDEKLMCTKEQRSKHNRNKEKDNTTTTNFTTIHTGDKDKIEKQLKDVKDQQQKEKIIMLKNEKLVNDINKNEPEAEQQKQQQAAVMKPEKISAITTIITDRYEKFDKFEKRKKSDNLNTTTTTVSSVNNNIILVPAQPVTVVDILAVDSLVPETAEFHVVTKKKKTKKQQRASLDDNNASYNFSNTTTLANMQRTATHNFLSTTGTTLSTGTTNKPHNNNTASSNYKYKHYNNNNNNNNNISSGADNYNNSNHYGTSYQQQQHHNHHYHPHHNHNQTKNEKSRRKSTSSVPPSEKSDSSDLDSVQSLPIESTSKSATTATTMPTTSGKQKQRQKQNNQINTATSSATTKVKSSSVASKNIVATNAPIISYADIARFNRESASIAAATSAVITTGASVATTIATTLGTITGASEPTTSINNINSNEVINMTSAISTNIVTAAVAATTAVDETASPSLVNNSNTTNNVNTTNAILTQKSSAKSKKSTNKGDFPELLSTTSTAIGTSSTVPTTTATFMTAASEAVVNVKPSTFKVISYSQSLTSSPIAVVNSSSNGSNNNNNNEATTTSTLSSNIPSVASKDNKEQHTKLEKTQRLKQPNPATNDNAKNELINVPTIINTTCPTTSLKQQTQQMLQKSKSVDHESINNNKTYNFNSTNMDQQYPALQKTVKRHSATNVINMVSPTNTAIIPTVAAQGTTTQFNFAAAAKQQFISNAASIISAPATNSLSTTSTYGFTAAAGTVGGSTTSAQNATKKSKEKSPPISNTTNTTKDNNEFSGPSVTTTRKTKKEKQTANATLSPNARKMVIDEIANSIVDSVEFGSVTSISQKASAATQTTSGNAAAVNSKIRAGSIPLGHSKPNVASAKSVKTSASANVIGKNITSNTNTINNTANGGTTQRPAVIILNDNRQANLTNNDFTFGDFNEDEMKFFDDEDAATNSGNELNEDGTKTRNKSTTVNDATTSISTALATTKNYLNDSGTSSDVVNNMSQHAVDVDMMLSTSADATSSPNTSLSAPSHGGVNQSNDSGIYATNITNNNTANPTLTSTTNVKLNTFLIATPAIATEQQQAQQSQQNNNVAAATTNCPQLETCNDIETAIIAAARAAAEQQQLHQHQSNYNYNNINIPQYQNSYSTSSSFSSTTSVSIDTKYSSSTATLAANELNFKSQHQVQPQHQRQQNYYNTHTSRRQHYDYDCEYNIQQQQHMRSRSSSSQCGFILVDDNTTQQQLTLSSATPAFVNKLLPHKEIEIHYRPPTLTATLNSKQQNDVIVDFIGTAWEEVANSKVTKYYDGQ